MGLEYRHLDDNVRDLMVKEITLDISQSILYSGKYFNDRGVELWPEMLLQAAKLGTDDTLSHAILTNGCLKDRFTRQTNKGTVWVNVPYNAHETVAEGNFSRFYLRALCVHADNVGVSHLVGYRAKYVENPRAGSQEKIGMLFHAGEMLADIRATMSTAPALGMPPGPNSGILACFP